MGVGRAGVALVGRVMATAAEEKEKEDPDAFDAIVLAEARYGPPKTAFFFASLFGKLQDGGEEEEEGRPRVAKVAGGCGFST